MEKRIGVVGIIVQQKSSVALLNDLLSQHGHLTVSYTHLDVYKRQAFPGKGHFFAVQFAVDGHMYRIILFEAGLGDLERNMFIHIFVGKNAPDLLWQQFLMLMVGYAFDPVSYTHLDVYKRQV